MPTEKLFVNDEKNIKTARKIVISNAPVVAQKKSPKKGGQQFNREYVDEDVPYWQRYYR